MTQQVPTSSLPLGFTLENRSVTVTVGNVQVVNVGQQVGLDVWFQIKRDLKAKVPNTCDLRLYNLSQSTRQSIEQYTQVNAQGANTKVVPVQIDAGYVGNVSTIFLGEMRSAQTVKDGDDFVTELTSGDGDQAIVLARSTKAFGSGCNALVVAKQLLSDMGVGLGNIATVSSVLQSSPLYNKGYVLKGNSMSHLTDLATSCGLECTIQGGVAQWTSLGQPLGGQAYSLSSSTGMLGSPTCDTKGVLSVETLLLPGITPGMPLVMNALFVQGAFRVTSVEITGSTFDTDFGCKIEAKKYGLVA